MLADYTPTESMHPKHIGTWKAYMLATPKCAVHHRELQGRRLSRTGLANEIHKLVVDGIRVDVNGLQHAAHVLRSAEVREEACREDLGLEDHVNEQEDGIGKLDAPVVCARFVVHAACTLPTACDEHA